MASRPPLDEVAAKFREYCEKVYADRSPLYERLAGQVATDSELLALASYSRNNTALPNLFLGAVHFLLLKNPKDPLSEFFPSVSNRPRGGDPFPEFRRFCLRHEGEIRGIISTHLVQTNEVGRCACLIPAYGVVADRSKGARLALVEVGASAGLNLLWDRYGYWYSDGQSWGDRFSPVQIECSLKGNVHLLLPDGFPVVETRLGLDLNPVDLDDADGVLWLRALVWPEHVKRAEQLMNAVRLGRQYRPSMMGGDMLELLPEILHGASNAASLCVAHSFVLSFLPQSTRDRFTSMITNAADKRPIFVISMEWYEGWELARLWLTRYHRATSDTVTLGHSGSHGEWLEWLGG